MKEPPAETNGVGRPLTGIKPMVIAELTKICEKRIDVKPTITKDEKQSDDLNAISNKVLISIKNKNMITAIPKKPNSSAITDKIKSDS